MVHTAFAQRSFASRVTPKHRSACSRNTVEFFLLSLRRFLILFSVLSLFIVLRMYVHYSLSLQTPGTERLSTLPIPSFHLEKLSELHSTLVRQEYIAPMHERKRKQKKKGWERGRLFSPSLALWLSGSLSGCVAFVCHWSVELAYRRTVIGHLTLLGFFFFLCRALQSDDRNFEGDKDPGVPESQTLRLSHRRGS